VVHFEQRARALALDAGLIRRNAEALALEEMILAQPGLLLAQAPSLAEGRWLDAQRRVNTRGLKHAR
jgi:hypothetical protein